MGYQYKSSKAEERAAALLRERGWNVNEPSCPDCHGFGFVPAWEVVTQGATTVSTSGYQSKRCPRGCDSPSFFFNTGTWAS